MDVNKCIQVIFKDLKCLVYSLPTQKTYFESTEENAEFS